MKYVKLLIAIFVAPIVAVIIYMVAAGAISETVTTEDEPVSKAIDGADATTEASTETAVAVEARDLAAPAIDAVDSTDSSYIAQTADETDVAVAVETQNEDSPDSGEHDGNVPGYEDVYVNDYANLLDAATEARIRDKLVEVREQRGIEMTLLTIDRIGDYADPESPYDESIESFATRLFNRWGIGNASRNDGVLVLVSRHDRKMRIELGAGYASSWDGTMQTVIDEAFLPDFRRDDYQRGIETGMTQVIYAITGTYPGEFDVGVWQARWLAVKRFFANIHWGFYTLLIAPLGWGVMLVRRFLRRRPRSCTRCPGTMELLGDPQEDEHLDGGQRLEEYLESVDYDVWQCPWCEHMQIERYRAWFSRASNCRSCGYRTLLTETTVIEHATTSSEGKKRLDYRCDNCGHESTEYRTIPQESESSSSDSSSSSSSFSGGHSSGGGASGSW